MKNLIWIHVQEWIRLKFFQILFFLGLIYLGFSFILGTLTFVEKQRLLFDFGLAGIETVSFFLSAFISSHALFRDIERRTLFLILSRPIRRWQILFSYLGSLAILNFFVVGILGAVLILFFDQTLFIDSYIAVLFSVWLKSIILSSFGLLIAILARPMMAFTLTLTYWGLAYSTPDVLFFAQKSKNNSLIILSRMLDYLVPRFYLFNWKNYAFLTHNLTLQSGLWVLIHCLAWITLLFSAASLAFNHKEVE